MGDGTIRALALERLILIGGPSDDGISPPVPDLVGHHAVAGMTEGQCWIEPSGGTVLLVNGRPMQGRHQLQHLDVVTLGDGTSLIFEDLGESTAILPSPTTASAMTSVITSIKEPPINAATLAGQAASFELPLGRSIIGRGSGATVQIDNKQVSRVHAAITVSPNAVTIEDLNSANGTTVNGVAVEGSQVITTGDRVAFGTIQFSIALLRLGET